MLIHYKLQKANEISVKFPYVLDKEAQQELMSMLKEDNLSKKERKSVLAAIQALKSGEMKQREQKLKQVRVVGMCSIYSKIPP